MIVDHDACQPFEFISPAVGTLIWMYAHYEGRRYTVSRVLFDGVSWLPCDWWAYA